MSLTDDEYTCLLIMENGENLIRMQNTRWYKPLGDMHARGLVKPLPGMVENYVITQAGQIALIERERGQDSAVRELINRQGEINANRQALHTKMWEAIGALSDAAELASKTTGESRKDALRKIAHEVLERALEKIA